MYAQYEKPTRLLYQSLRTVFVPDWKRKIRRRFRWVDRLQAAVAESLIHKDLAEMIHLGERLEKYQSYSPLTGLFDLAEVHRYAFLHPHLQAVLERCDCVAAEFSIESRHPLLDVRLAEFCLSLSWQLKTRRGWTKAILREMLNNRLPESVVWRSDIDSLGAVLPTRKSRSGEPDLGCAGTGFVA